MLNVPKVSLGSFSETQHLVDPALLEALITSTAVRMHVSFDLLKDAPVSVQITPGKTCERKTLRLEVDIKPGGAYSYILGD